MILGRGSFTESFPLFGYDSHDYELLFEEKLDLFAQLSANRPSRGRAQTRAPLKNQRVFPPLGPDGLTPGSASAAARNR